MLSVKANNLTIRNQNRKTTLLYLVAVVLFVQFSLGQKSKRDDIQRQLAELTLQSNFTPSDTVYINLLNDLGKEIRFYKTDSLLELSKKALKYSIDISYEKGRMASLLGLGDYHSDKGNHSKAISYYEKALAIAHKTKNQNFALTCRNKLANEYNYKGDYAKSLNGHLENLELAKNSNNMLMLSIINENIADLYASQKDYEQALMFFKRVKKINEELNNPIYGAETMSNMASVYADMGELELAMFNINGSIPLFEKHGILDWLAFAYEVKGKIYLKQNKFDWALYWYKQSGMLHQNLEDDRAEIDLLNGMAEAYLGLQKDSISETYASKAFDISSKINFIEGIQKCAHTLYRINKNKHDFPTSLEYHELYQELTDSLSRNENKKSLSMLKTKIEHDKQKERLMVQNERALAQQRNYIYAAFGILLVFVGVTFLVRRSEKIQKELFTELKAKTANLERNEIQLRKSNETKNKLFSIIGHDLRGPIGAFQGLLKLFKEGEIAQHELVDFIPKLRMDIDHISFTLNNLLSWGQSQMNGAATNPTTVAIETLVESNINLLSEIAENKSIKLNSKISANTLIWADSHQMDIVIRNLISNALKFTPKSGMVTLEALDQDNHWIISVKDTGVGMDKMTLKSLFDKNSNMSTYGTNNEKGTGLGLSLCKEMVENNGGSIWAESNLRIGTIFYFTVPKSTDKYIRTA